MGLAFFPQGPNFIKAYCQAATNLVDRDRGVGNDLPQPRGLRTLRASSSFILQSD